jgi:choline-sulfatase
MGPLLIGKYASETNRNWGHFNNFDEKDTFITERLHEAGFRTLSVQGHHYFGKGGSTEHPLPSGFERGVDVLDLSAAPSLSTPWAIENTTTSEALTDAALSLLSKDENTKGRFFLWVHYLDPHADYLKHEGFDFGSDARGLYDGEIAFTDMHLGRLLDAIAKAPFADRTAILLTSDHGEAFGEHGMINHGRELWEPLVRVPLIVYVPGAKPHHVAARRSAIDLVPTIIDLTHIQPPPSSLPEGSTDFVSGVSLLGDVFLKEGAEPAKRDVLVDMPAGTYNDERRALIHDDLKLYVSNEARFDLYDLASDPGEENNIAEADPTRMKAMMERYAAWKARLHEVKVTGPKK